MSSKGSFQYVVIGAGSAGCVVANRLSADPQMSVLLLEAGGADSRPEIDDPAGMLKTWGSEIDWKYETEPEPALNGRKIPIARGKVLGGSSAINAMIHIRGNRRDFDHWNFLGNDGWSYDEVLPFFKKSENYLGPASQFHGTGGPLTIVNHPRPSPVALAFANAGPELGFGGPDWDFNGEQQEDGTGLYQYTLDTNGKRASAAAAFLRPILTRKNLTVTLYATVSHLLFENNRTVAVEFIQNGQTQQARVEGEAIVCAGTFDSPKILMRSGVGPADLLKSHGIPVVADLPGAGQNLQDHLLLPVLYRSKRELPVPMFIAEAGLFTRTRSNMKAASPDLQFHFSAGLPAFAPPGLTGPWYGFVPILVRPQSVGSVVIGSRNPLDPGFIRTNYLQMQTDLDVLLRGIELSREIAHTRAFSEFGSDEVAPGTHRSKRELSEYIRGHCSTVWHVSGTCVMGRGPMAVVDPQLRVYGVEGLRVADASIMPTVVAGNTNAACIMIGEKLADMLQPQRTRS